MDARQEALIESEQRAIKLAKKNKISLWQLHAAYYLAMLNNQAMDANLQDRPIVIQFTPGKEPILEAIE